MVFRMPDKASQDDIYGQALDKLKYRRLDGPVYLEPADEAAIVRWLMGHTKKAQLGEYGR